MKWARNVFLLLLVILACGVPLSRVIKQATEVDRRPTERVSEYDSLFNGEDLDGFTTWLRDTEREDPRGVFSVQDGLIRISGDGFGYLATEESFRNFHLILEYRWGDQAGLDRKERAGKALDSGVFLRASGPDGNSHDGDGAFMAAIECNIFQGATGDFLLIRGDDADGNLIAPEATVEAAPESDADGFPFWQPGGALRTLKTWGRVNWRHKSQAWKDVRDFRGANDVEKSPGQWNKVECVCIDGDITVILNGVTVNRIFAASPREGRILLQCEGSEIFFRDLVVKRMDVPAF